MFLLLGILVFWPEVALWLPQLMDSGVEFVATTQLLSARSGGRRVRDGRELAFDPADRVPVSGAIDQLLPD